MVKNLPDNAGGIRDVGSIQGLERSPGGGHGSPLQYSCLENPMDRGAWWAMVCRVTKGWKHLNMHAYTHTQDTMAGMNSVLKEDSTEIKTNGLLN